MNKYDTDNFIDLDSYKKKPNAFMLEIIGDTERFQEIIGELRYFGMTDNDIENILFEFLLDKGTDETIASTMAYIAINL